MLKRWTALLLLALIALAGCAAGTPAATPTPLREIAVVLPQGTENDKGFNQSTLEGARAGAEASGFQFKFATSQATTDYEKNIEQLIAGGTDLIISMGFLSGDAVANAARRHPDVRFLTDTVYSPGFGCPTTVADCYTTEGGLANVTSLAYAEDEVAYISGVLAGCMSQSGTIAAIGGVEIPPVIRFIKGYENGARSVRPEIEVLSRYIPDFNDPAAGEVIADEFIEQDADVLFVAAGNTGNGGLQAANRAGIMAIGVDTDQYVTFPDVKAVLLTSAKKNIDVAIGDAIKDYAADKLEHGLRPANIANGGVGLAPYHDWDSRISAECKQKVTDAETAIKADPAITGLK